MYVCMYGIKPGETVWSGNFREKFFTEDTYSVKVEDFLWGLKGGPKKVQRYVKSNMLML